MGFIFKDASYSTVDKYVDAMKADINNHYLAFGNLVKADETMLRALRSKDWAKFARGYNGKDYASNNYDTKMEKAYKRYINEH